MDRRPRLETGDVSDERQTAPDGEERTQKREYSQYARVSRAQTEPHSCFQLFCDGGDHICALFWGFAGENFQGDVVFVGKCNLVNLTLRVVIPIIIILYPELISMVNDRAQGASDDLPKLCVSGCGYYG